MKNCNKKECKKFRISSVVGIYSMLVLSLFSMYIAYGANSYTDNAVVCEYTEDSFMDIPLPPETRTFLISNVSSLYQYPWEDGTIIGRYDNSEKEIKILFEQDIYGVRKSFIHEISHHWWEHNLSREQKAEVKISYDRFCQSENEFYAYMNHHFGAYRWME